MPLDLATQKILVTGGAGFLGAHVVEKLKLRGVPAENIIIPRSEDFDLRKKENCEKAVVGKNMVIHVAGMTGGVEFHKNHPAEIFYGNLVMGVELMDAARRAGVKKFVTIGSATEYPEHAQLPFREEDIWQGAPEPLHAPYTIAKKMLLVEAQAYRKQYGFNAIHLLMTNMYGPGDVRKEGFVIPMLVNRILEVKRRGGDSLEVWGTGNPTRDFLYVEDAADGIVLAAEKYDKPDPVNIASGWEISIREIVSALAELMDFKGEIVWNTSKPEGQARRLLDTTKAEQEFGFKPLTDFKTGLKKTIDYYANLEG